MDLQTGNCKFGHLWRYVKIIKLSKYYFITYMLTYLLKFHFTLWRHGSWSLLWVSIFVFAPALYLIPYTSYLHLKNCQCKWIICNKKINIYPYDSRKQYYEMKWNENSNVTFFIFVCEVWTIYSTIDVQTNTALVTGW